MPSAIIVGSGPSAAAVAICLADKVDWRITVLDIGLDLEPDHRDSRDRLSTLPRERWVRRDVLDISARPTDPITRSGIRVSYLPSRSSEA